MRILWIVNLLFPEAEALMGGGSILKATGGWLLAASQALLETKGVELAVATVSSSVKDLTVLQGEIIKYYVIPKGKGNFKYNPEYKKYWVQIEQDFCPEVVHIHGTEFSHGLAYLRACGSDKAVVSLQGISSMICRYYLSGMTKWDILRSITLRDLIKGSLYTEKKGFKRRGESEITLFKEVRYAIGRTSFDKAHFLWANPNGQYFVGNETLRPEFYTGQWLYSDCVPHSIFISQLNFAVKGGHVFLKSLPSIIKKYPDVQVRVGGIDLTKSGGSIYDRLKMHGYGKMLLNIIKDNGLEKHVTFLGNLDADEMKKEMLNANVYVCPSSCENSPNSLCEAQMLGVPNVSAYVGGIPDLVPCKDCGELYRFEEYEMLAEIICGIFSTSATFDNSIMRKVAFQRHDSKSNCEQLLNVYKKIMNG